MAEDVTPVVDETTDPATDDKGGDLKEALRQERAKRQAAEKKATEFEKAETKRKEADAKTVDELRGHLATKDAELEQLRNAFSTEKKTGKLRGLLADAHDANDVLAFIDLSEIADDADDDDFLAVVTGLKEKKAYLFKPADDGKKPAPVRTTAGGGGNKKEEKPAGGSVLQQIASRTGFGQ